MPPDDPPEPGPERVVRISRAAAGGARRGQAIRFRSGPAAPAAEPAPPPLRPEPAGAAAPAGVVGWLRRRLGL